jgi:hypothetical protein
MWGMWSCHMWMKGAVEARKKHRRNGFKVHTTCYCRLVLLQGGRDKDWPTPLGAVARMPELWGGGGGWGDRPHAVEGR